MEENLCFHMHILIEPIEVQDGSGKIRHMCRETCQVCGKVVFYGKDLNFTEED